MLFARSHWPRGGLHTAARRHAGPLRLGLAVMVPACQRAAALQLYSSGGGRRLKTTYPKHFISSQLQSQLQGHLGHSNSCYLCIWYILRRTVPDTLQPQPERALVPESCLGPRPPPPPRAPHPTHTHLLPSARDTGTLSPPPRPLSRLPHRLPPRPSRLPLRLLHAALPACLCCPRRTRVCCVQWRCHRRAL